MVRQPSRGADPIQVFFAAAVDREHEDRAGAALLVAAGAFLWFLWRRGAVSAAFSRPAPAAPAAARKEPLPDARATSACAPPSSCSTTTATS